MELRDELTIAAIFLGPVVAVQLTIILENRKKKRERKEKIFRTLMATRATPISPEHVQALNMIDVEFYGNKKDRPILDAWKMYLDHLNNATQPPESWLTKRVELLIDLLYVMAQRLDFDFDKTQLKNAIYYPKLHVDMEDEQTIIRKGFAALFKGTPLPVISTTPPPPEDVQKDWEIIRKGLAALFKNEQVKKIAVETEPKNEG